MEKKLIECWACKDCLGNSYLIPVSMIEQFEYLNAELARLGTNDEDYSNYLSALETRFKDFKITNEVYETYTNYKSARFTIAPKL